MIYVKGHISNYDLCKLAYIQRLILLTGVYPWVIRQSGVYPKAFWAYASMRDEQMDIRHSTEITTGYMPLFQIINGYTPLSQIYYCIYATLLDQRVDIFSFLK